MNKTEEETKSLAQNRAMTSIINQLCDIIEEKDKTIEELQRELDEYQRTD